MLNRILSGKFLTGFLLAILVFHSFALYYHWYWRVWWLDVPLHMLGGVWLTVFVFWFLRTYKKDLLYGINDFELLILVIGVIALVGVFWEFYEFFEDLIFKSDSDWVLRLQVGYVDTLKDLADDILGGLIAFFSLRRFFGPERR